MLLFLSLSINEVSSELGDTITGCCTTTLLLVSLLQFGSKSSLEGVVERDGILFTAIGVIDGLLLRECWKSSNGISSDLDKKIQNNNEIDKYIL